MDELKLLHEFGFSQNEAKCYIALHKKSPMTGYQVAKAAKITRTMVYDILRRLERKGTVHVIEGNPKLYSAVSYKKLVSSMKREHAKKLEELEKNLERIGRSVGNQDYVLNVSNHDELKILIKTAIREAREEIYLSLWDLEARLFNKELEEANGRGVRIYIFSFCKMPFDFGTQFVYNMQNADRNFPRRRIIAVFDRSLVIMGEGNKEISEIGITTRNPMLVELGIDQMLLDIILLHTLKSAVDMQNSIDVHEYYNKIQEFFKSIGLPRDLPRRIDE